MSIKEHPPHSVHIPVLLDATLALLDPKLGESYLDLTAGYGGHARAVLSRTRNYESSVLVDRDNSTIPYLEDLLAQHVSFINQDFFSAAQKLVEEKKRFDLVVADLGVSSPQLDRADRGFSFNKDGPLDMRMDSSGDLTAEDVIMTYDARKLTDIIIRYGEEKPRDAKAIAETIVAKRPFRSTVHLADAIAETIRRPRGKVHPATRTFQALRIEVNNELQQVEDTLALLPKLLNPGGRVAIISFHSLEDRLVKRYFALQKANGYEAELTILTKKPIAGTEDVHNPRARSAKLRVAVKK